jgi:hypothetical protein
MSSQLCATTTCNIGHLPFPQTFIDPPGGFTFEELSKLADPKNDEWSELDNG